MSIKMAPASLPRVLFLISHLQLIEQPSLLATEVVRVLPEYAGQVDVEVADCAFADILSFTEEAKRSGRADIVVCAGATGAFLQRRLDMPVVLMQVSGQDILYALDKARETLSRAAVVNYKRPLVELDYIRRLWGADIGQGTYTTLAEARSLIERLEHQGYGVIIGSSMVTQIARQHGLVGILAVSPTAIRRALDDALATLRATRIEADKKLWLNATLRHLNYGVLAVDANGIVQAINPALARVLEVRAEESIGRPLNRVAPQLDLKRLLADDSEIRTQVLQLGRETVLAHLYPMHEQGVLLGAVLVCQDAGSVQGADRQLRISAKRKEYRARYRLDQIIGDSPLLRTQLALARRYAGTDSTVLIHGESGTGKELFAQGIHNASTRASGPFVAINCASLPETLLESELFGYEEGAFTSARKGGKPGLFEQAHTGTIFLDEIGDMPIALQTRLLRVLQEREVVRLGSTQPTPIDVRVIAATHRSLKARITDGEFREDLYYRLNILRLRLPALRERLGDLHALAQHILAGIVTRDRLALDAGTIVERLLPTLSCHAWPGNIRELKNVLERAALIFTDVETALSGQDLLDALFDTMDEASVAEPAAGPAHVPTPDQLQAILARHGGSLTRAAQALGMSRTTLWRRLRATASTPARTPDSAPD